jgi:hypothetical protein
MTHNAKTHRWILLWSDDSADPDQDIHETADSPAEAHEAIRRILSAETWTPEDAAEQGGDQTEPAYTALLREAFHGDMTTGLLDLAGEAVKFPCDGGTLTIVRER